MLKIYFDNGKRKELSLKKKAELIKKSNSKNQRQLTEMFGVGKTRVKKK